jgi:hypothetical protein
MVRTGLVVLFSVFTIGLSHVAEAQPPVNRVAASMADFRKRVDAYLALRNAITQKHPDVKETGDPAKISAREKALGQAIAKARASAKAGDIFGDLAPDLLRILDEDWSSRSPAERKKLFGELPSGVRLKVNQPYPSHIPLVNAPANLLASLPMLPEELEYRLVDRRLLLRDRDANLVVDVLTGTEPKKPAGLTGAEAKKPTGYTGVEPKKPTGVEPKK